MLHAPLRVYGETKTRSLLSLGNIIGYGNAPNGNGSLFVKRPSGTPHVSCDWTILFGAQLLHENGSSGEKASFS